MRLPSTTNRFFPDGVRSARRSRPPSGLDVSDAGPLVLRVASCSAVPWQSTQVISIAARTSP